MTATKFATTTLTASLLMAAITFGSAHAEVVQCVERDGSVLFTDRACSNDAEDVSAAENVRAPSVKQNVLAENAVKKQERRTLPTDVSTMKAARTAFTLTDQSAGWFSQQKVAGLN